ncbi:MAG: phosphoribosylformylglycinamidine synthase subunit PurL [Halobacteriaceae archaeon]
MALAAADRDLVSDALGRELTRAEATLFENLWSEHCAYRSSRPLLSAFDSAGEQVVVGPGDDAAVVSVPETDDDTYLALGVESHNHPSYVDPYDGAATGVGGIVRDIISMGAYPVALADSLYFGDFDREHSRYLLDGVVEGISDYGNAIGVPTVAGSTAFHDDYEGNPLVNVACVGLLDDERLVRAGATTPGNRLVLVGNATGRDGLGGASFASEDLSEDAETEDRPAVQVGDPYTEKLLIEASEVLLERDLVAAARDLGAAGLGGATCEMAAIGGTGAAIELDAVHQREPGMNALEILLAESQERMCYEVAPGDVEDVRAVAERFDLGCSVVGTVTDDGRYVCTFEGETVVDAPADLLADGAPTNDLERGAVPDQPATDHPDVALDAALGSVLASPTTASKRWVYRQYDHEVGARTAVRPGADAALLAIREGRGADEAPAGLALSAGASPNWTDAAPYDGARAVALENATNLAAVGADPLAAVDCLNGGNPETPEVYGGFAAMVDGLADGCAALDVPVVGGNVSLYNDSAAGPIPPTPTVAMVGTREGLDAPGTALEGDGTVLLVGGHREALGGSELLAREGGADAFPALPEDPGAVVETLAAVARADHALAVHDVSDGGVAVTLAEMVGDAGLNATLPSLPAAFSEAPGRAVVETTDPDAVREAFAGVAPVTTLGEATNLPVLSLEAEGEAVSLDADEVADRRDVLGPALD